MKTGLLKCWLVVVLGATVATLSNAFVTMPSNNNPFGVVVTTTTPSTIARTPTPTTSLFMAKYKTMDDILALYDEEMPLLINFYDSSTEKEISGDVARFTKLLEGRANVCNIKQQDYGELAKLWDANEVSPSMILFKDGKPLTRLYGTYNYLDVVSKIGSYCRPEGAEFVPYK